MSIETSQSAASASDAGVKGLWTTALRIVLPEGNDEDKRPLYVDFGRARPLGEEAKTAHGGVAEPLPPLPMLDEGRGLSGTARRGATLPDGVRVSFGTIMNGFPASYWRKWTDVQKLRLKLVISGSVSVMIYQSNAQGRAQRIDTARVENASAEEVTCDLPLKAFADGGWYWFDLIGHGQGRLDEGEWQVLGAPPRPGRMSIGITTFNRPDYCSQTLQALGSASELIERVNRIYVVDQGTKHVEDDSGFPLAQQLLGDKLRVIYQDNLGGSGGFSRGMYESVRAAESEYHLVLDDDVQIEPEGIERALTFASFCRNPTIVGGMMFDLLNKSVLHTWGECLDRYQWFWGPVQGFPEGVDVLAHPLRSTPWMHRRLDVDYNGWWMCLMPTETIRQLGLALPVFIKWDDAEYGLRAQRAGVYTVTLPGAAVWHMSWADKDDTIDWQAYFHERNRLLTSLLYSPYKLGGRLPRKLVVLDMKHAVSSEYYAQKARILALRDILAGPDHLHATIRTRQPQLRAMTKDYAQSTYESDMAKFPEVDREKPWHKGRIPRKPAVGMLLPWTLKTAVKHLFPVSKSAEDRPQASLAHADASFWVLANFDSVLVSSADGTGTAWYKRDPKTFVGQLAEEAALRTELVAKWEPLRADYREAFPHITSFEAWEKTFGLDPHQP